MKDPTAPADMPGKTKLIYFQLKQKTDDTFKQCYSSPVKGKRLFGAVAVI